MTGLNRFLTAQADSYDAAHAELAAGRKTSHWMWYIFPQLRGLGRSSTAQYYGLAGLDEAEAYWRHPVLGPRLKACTELVLAIHGKTAHQIFGSPDDMKLRSCMTLFELAAPEEPAFGQVLERYYGGERDGATVSAVD
ncbi:MAG: hypothetical protein JWP36_910 [Paucimonas sp.]|nr:hypothetical protein [Paucimonas sp.]